MSTRSEIGIEGEDGRILAVYCHWDGYPEGVGRCLSRYTREKTGKLISGGSLSYVGETLKESKSHKDKVSRLFRSPDEFATMDGGCGYNIEWRYFIGLDGKWRVVEMHEADNAEGKPNRIRLLSDVLRQQEKEHAGRQGEIK